MPTFLHDGLALHYEDTGSGSPPIVLLHALGGDHTTLDAQRAYFAPRHRVIALDFRGFGASDKPLGAYPIERLADDVAALCAHLALGPVALVGHSLGGNVALVAAARHPALASAVVILEALVVPPPPLREVFRPVLEAVRTPAWAEAIAAFSDQLAGPWIDEPQRARLRELMARGPQHVLVSLLEHLLALDTDAAAAACQAPVLYVASGPWYTDVERFRRLCPQLVTAQLVGCGHHFPLEVPDQTNAVVGRFIDRFARAHTAGA